MSLSFSLMIATCDLLNNRVISNSSLNNYHANRFYSHVTKLGDETHLTGRLESEMREIKYPL